MSDKKITPEMARAELARRELSRRISASQQNMEPTTDETSMLGNIARGYGTYAKGATKGILQGLGDFGASAGNLGLSGIEYLFGLTNNPPGFNFPLPRIPHPHIVNEHPESPLEEYSQDIGQLFSTAGIPLGAVAKGAKASQAGIGALRKILQGASTGAALGYAGNEGNRGEAAAIGGVLGGAVPAVTVAGAKTIAKRLSQNKKLAEESAATAYNNFFNQARNEGVEYVKPPKIDTKDIVKHSQSRFHEALVNYLQDPTLEKAHWAQSDLGMLIRHLKDLDKRVGLASPQQTTLKNAIEAQQKIRANMFKETNLGSHPALADEYSTLSQEYAKNVVPYKQMQELTDYENKKLKPSKLIKSLLKNDEFMLGIGKEYPEILLNKAMNSKIAKLLGLSALGGVGFEGGRKFIR